MLKCTEHCYLHKLIFALGNGYREVKKLAQGHTVSGQVRPNDFWSRFFQSCISSGKRYFGAVFQTAFMCNLLAFYGLAS